MTFPFLAAALLIQSLPAPDAAQWEPFGPPQEGMATAIDPASIARSGNEVAFLLRQVRAAPDPEGMTVAVIAYTIDCRARTATLEDVDLYRTDGSFGRSIAGDDPRPITRDPMHRALFERVCPGRR